MQSAGCFHKLSNVGSYQEIRRLFDLYAELLLLHQKDQRLAALLSGPGVLRSPDLLPGQKATEPNGAIHVKKMHFFSLYFLVIFSLLFAIQLSVT